MERARAYLCAWVCVMCVCLPLCMGVCCVCACVCVCAEHTRSLDHIVCKGHHTHDNNSIEVSYSFARTLF